MLTLSIDHRYWSPYAMSAYVALKVKAVPFEVQLLNLDQLQHQAADYTQRALTGRVPMLQHDGFALTESSAIDEYIDAIFPSPQYAPLYPSDVQSLARARQVQAWLRSDLMPIRVERSTAVLFGGQAFAPLTADAQAAVSKLYAAAQSMLAGKAQLFEQWCIADVDLAVMLNRLLAAKDDMPADLKAYAQLQWQHPAVQAWLANAHQHRA